MKSDPFEEMEILRAWFLQKQRDDDIVGKEARWEKELDVMNEAFGSHRIESDAESSGEGEESEGSEE